MASIYDFEAERIDGSRVPLRQYEGQVLLIVNTASACGFTPQFGGLEALHQQYGSRGLAVLGFPCNQFGHQDPGSNGEIASFCQLNYGVSFPMMAKIDVNGPDASPLYRWLTAVLVMATGVLGAVSARYLFDALRIREPAVRGFALGTIAHGIGTARAFQVSEEAGAFAGLAMGLSALFSALALPLLAGWLLRVL